MKREIRFSIFPSILKITDDLFDRKTKDLPAILVECKHIAFIFDAGYAVVILVL